MELGMDLNIQKIYTIIHKKEVPGFFFDNPGREWDGFVLFTDGFAEFWDAAGQVYPCKKGSLILMRKDMVYTIFSREGCAYVTAAYDFSQAPDESLEKLPVVIEASESMQAKVLRMTKKWQYQLWDSQIVCRVGLLEFYYELLSQYRESGGEYADPTVRTAIHFIHSNFKRNFTAEEIAEQCAVSPSYLRARFRRTTGMTITDYRNDLRIRAAKQMLQSGLFTVKETALELGYCDVYYFTKSFAGATGMPPAAYAIEKGRK